MFLEDGPCREGCGLWLQSPPGSGKTTLYKLLTVRYPGQVYVAIERASTGGYDRTCLLGYDVNRHRMILFNDVKGRTDSQGRTIFTRQMHTLFREITDGLSMPFTWSGREYAPTPIAKVIINSTEDPPFDDEFQRRYLCMLSDKSGFYRIRNSEILMHKGTEEEAYVIKRRECVPAAEDYEVLTKMPPDCSIAFRKYLATHKTFEDLEDFLFNELRENELEIPDLAFETIQSRLLEKHADMSRSLTNSADKTYLDCVLRRVGMPALGSEDWKNFILQSGSYLEFLRRLRQQIDSLSVAAVPDSTLAQVLDALTTSYPELWQRGPRQNEDDFTHLKCLVRELLEDARERSRVAALAAGDGSDPAGCSDSDGGIAGGEDPFCIENTQSDPYIECALAEHPLGDADLQRALARRCSSVDEVKEEACKDEQIEDVVLDDDGLESFQLVQSAAPVMPEQVFGDSSTSDSLGGSESITTSSKRPNHPSSSRPDSPSSKRILTERPGGP